MRPFNLLPPELRPRIPGEGDPRVAWGVLGVLAAILLVVIVSIGMSNKAKTLNDEAAAMQAEADRKRAAVALIPTRTDDLSETVRQRTLLVGGLANLRFPWNVALRDLSKTLPPDVTLDTLSSTSATAADDAATGAAAGGVAAMHPQMTLSGCVSGWVGYARFLTWLRQMPGVESVKSTSSAVGTVVTEAPEDEGATAETNQVDDQERQRNCGPEPLVFTLNVNYRQRDADLKGLPKPEAAPAGATGSTGTPATGTPAASGTGG